MVSKFLDLNNFSWQRRPFALSNDGRKVWAIVLSLSATQRKLIRVNFFVFFFCHSLLRSTEILIPRLRDASSSPPYLQNYVLSLKADYFFFRVSGIHVKLSHRRFSRLATSLLALCVFQAKKECSLYSVRGNSQEKDILPFSVVQPCLLKQLVSTVWSDILLSSEDVCLAVSSFQEEGSKKKEQSRNVLKLKTQKPRSHRALSSRKNAFTSGRIKPRTCLLLPQINCHGYLSQVS